MHRYGMDTDFTQIVKCRVMIGYNTLPHLKYLSITKIHMVSGELKDKKMCLTRTKSSQTVIQLFMLVPKRKEDMYVSVRGERRENI